MNTHTAKPTKMSLKIDTDAGAAYLRLSNEPVARTVEFSDDIMIDLDGLEVVIGIEVLDLSVSVPLDEITQQHHIDGNARALLDTSIVWGQPRGYVEGGAASTGTGMFSAGAAARC